MSRKADKWEARARELCLEAGLNPDNRVNQHFRHNGKPKSIPAWCAYRDAAKKEHDVAESNAVAISATREYTEYSNKATLKVYGDHEETTISQMHACMKYGKVTGGVLMPDGHLGYAQPVGGVIAYEDQISVSGVGFDIGCFSGNTRIFTLDGNNPTLKECEGEEVYVLGCLPNGKPIPAKATCHKTRKNADLMKVTLDNGAIIKCTPDHQFMLRDGTYRRADRLSPDNRLMPLYVTLDQDGYVLVRDSSNKKLMRLHKMVYNAGLIPKIEAPEGELVIHHRNHDKTNNLPFNLEAQLFNDHAQYHASLRDFSYTKTEEYEQHRIAGIKKFWETARDDKVFMGKRAQSATANITSYMKNNQGHFREAIKDNGKRGSKYLVAFNNDPKTVKRAKARAKQSFRCPLCPVIVTGSPALLYHHARKNHPNELKIGAELVGKTKSVAEKLTAGANNHKVLSVERLDSKQDVYCLTVPGLNNFALDSGVFVHNCGNMAVQLDLPFSKIKSRVDVIARDIASNISFGVGRKNETKVEHALFDDEEAWKKSDMEGYRAKAEGQLGTVGSGNHYVDIMVDDQDGLVWIGVHFGSRGLGHTSATKYIKLAGGKDGIHVAPTILDDTSELGQRYIAAMELAGQYAYAGREWVVERVRQITGGRVTHSVHNHHNYSWREEHAGKKLWVVRKGATPAFPGQQGFVGGSMGDDAVIVEGVESSESKETLYSTIHGAGRKFGRKEAKRRFTKPEMQEWLKRRQVTLIGGDLDESPMAYRRLSRVLEHAKGIKVLNTLKPVIVIMAGSAEFDPFRD